MLGLLGKKVGMTMVFDQNGDRVPVTVLQMGECRTVQVKTAENDGYNAIQIGFDEITKKDKKKTPKTAMGHFKKADLKPMRHLREFRLDDISGYNPGKKLTVEIFAEGEIVDVTGVSKGRGFAGVFKRHGMHGQSQTRGTHEVRRHGGSIGNHTWPARVIKGRKMAGHMGSERVTMLGQKVFKIIGEDNVLLIKGAVPGPNGGVVEVKKSPRNRKKK
ncbi:MAG: 50S ribosomal protein L3 [Nitrospinae bacterium]|nr:50S ribosomal protein L3 [Nitrospinota bacterium]